MADQAALDPTVARAARLTATGLRGPRLPDAPAVVDALLAVQGQELQPALWGLSRRVAPSSRPGRAAVNAALADGRLLRTHVLRPTWHLVRPRDARWLLELTAPRITRLMASTEKSWDLGDLGPGTDAVAAAVADGPRTRAQIRDELVARGVLDPAAPGLAFTQMLMHAELQRLVISGAPPDGKELQHQSYAAFDDRVPAGYGPLGERFDAAGAVLELWRRYLPGRAFATVNDLRQWSGLTARDLRPALDALIDAGEVVQVPGAGGLDGLTPVATAATAARWLDDGAAGPEDLTSEDPARDDVPRAGSEVDLLQAYDELLMSYRETRHVVLDPTLPPPDRAGAYVHTVAVDGVVAARWRWPAPSPRGAVVDVQWLRDPSPAEQGALDVAVADLDAYLAG
ncbi:winged helix DNA-binding domain-containing protein [Krasilnikoviella flava]|uniref:Winged helix DNA-binding domain-containing protein n=1 Tax=Krasilnikoviella flava TaxID=526729 RepID=A0A1T5M0I4_9MICO|nr:winged helix DNA-binding domain-containing protein [Krasilnikoviella flava]SKC81643.1 Winged helix DNA-binding domain-containing protein [Krasilnikoviella flava]